MRAMFGDAPFAAGSIHGWRTFHPRETDDGGAVLVGPMYPQNFVPGENRAFCLASNPVFSMHHDNGNLVQRWNEEVLQFGRAVTMPDHIADFMANHCGTMQCACGFYCYWDNQPGTFQHHWNSIDTLIEGYGHITYGNRGFRCSKAKVVALVKPELADSKPKRWLTRREKGWIAVQWATVPLAAWGFSEFASPWLTVIPAALALGVSGMWALVRSARIDIWNEQRQGMRFIDKDLWEKIVARYPDAQVFDSLEDAKRVFPPTNPFEGES